MKEIQSYDDFERALKDSKDPFINPEAIKNRVHEYAQSRKGKSLPRKLIPVLTVILVLSIGAAAFGENLKNAIYNKQGEKVYEYGMPRISTNGIDPIEQYGWDKYEALVDKTKKAAKPGELSYLIVTQIYKSNKSIHYYQSRKSVFNINDLKNSTSTKFKTPVSNDITFNVGSIDFKSAIDTNWKSYRKVLDGKYKEAVDKGLEYIIWNEPLGKEADDIHLTYTVNRYYTDGKYINDTSTLFLTINRLRAVEGDAADANRASKIKVGDEEALYIKGTKPEIIYVDTSSKKPLTYNFQFDNAKLKDTIISLIESMQ